MRLDLHIHSKYSFDSILETRKIIKTAIKKKLDGIAITDHDTIIGGKKAVRENKSSLLIIVGAEIRAEIGDLIGLFLNEEIKSRNSLEILDEIKSQGGIAVLPHPFKGHKITKETANELLKQIDCIEALNSRAPITMEQRQILTSFNKSLVACSDAHFASEIGSCQTIIKTSSTDMDHIKDSILSKNKILFCTHYGQSYLQEFSQLIGHVKLRRYASLLPQSLSLAKTMLGKKS
jgi:predicted metal-dependent phosphoesterase TrpH